MIYYGVIAKNRYVVADYTKYDGDFPTIFQQIINATPQTDKIAVYTRDERSYYIRHNSDGYAFGCLVPAIMPADGPTKFLEKLQTRVYAGKSSTPRATASVFTKIIRELVVIYP